MYNRSINEAVGQNIRSLREGQGYNQDEFSESCDISRAYYGRIERGEHSPTLETCNRIAKSLGVRISELFKDIEF